MSFIGYGQGETEFVPRLYTPATPACVYHENDYEGTSRILRSQNVLNRSGAPCSTFIVNYTGFTPEAQAAFQFAVDIWAMSIESNQTIRINASFDALAPGVLGQAGPTGFLTSNHPDAVPNVFYPRALWEKIEDTDSSPFGGSIDISSQFSSTFNFYFGTDANPPGGQIDFVSVVLHEIGHGLGFTGFAFTDGTTGQVRDTGTMLPSVYDITIENGSAQSLLDTAIFTDPSTALHAQITGGDLFNNGTITTVQNGGVKPKIFAPNPYQGGSSYSHWDTNTFPISNVNTLMTPSIGPGVAVHDPGPITLGMFEDMGWSICGGSLLSTQNYSLDTVEVSPNPFTSSLTIKLPIASNDNYNLNLFDINGRIVLSESREATNGTITISNLDQLEDALYFVKITNEKSGASFTKKVIKN
ncbi:serine protease [Winogradskyella sp. PG-2]|nr:serine protease [Winogradskyella sp. PG-2]